MSISEVIDKLKENSMIADPERRGLNVCVEKELLRMAAVYLEDYMLCLEQMNANKGKKPVTYNDTNRADCPICGARKKWYTENIEKIDKYEFEM